MSLRLDLSAIPGGVRGGWRSGLCPLTALLTQYLYWLNWLSLTITENSVSEAMTHTILLVLRRVGALSNQLLPRNVYTLLVAKYYSFDCCCTYSYIVMYDFYTAGGVAWFPSL